MNCPVCGRPLRVKIHMIGEDVCCGHCMATFVAETNVDRNAGSRRTNEINRRIEAILAVDGEKSQREEFNFWTETVSELPVAHLFYESH